ncbi:hypothetical protein JTE90_009271 [Oedothorax gibbosus]|uniref:Uncharacterized protein n=1 Tax=Oedothorax gibbosus TaxID=931172 RepID=A0AAV6V3G5_9ARAC|nr:hypothetical protein JTE90_009271 [Oedothorax gibbosus]
MDHVILDGQRYTIQGLPGEQAAGRTLRGRGLDRVWSADGQVAGELVRHGRSYARDITFMDHVILDGQRYTIQGLPGEQAAGRALRGRGLDRVWSADGQVAGELVRHG